MGNAGRFQELENHLRHALAQVAVLPRRMRLETPGVRATVPMLRGVWGAALHGLDHDVYRRVFGPNDPPLDPADPRRAERRAGGPLAGRRAAASPQPAPSAEARELPRGHSTFVPGYILRPAPPDPHFAPAVEWVLIGAAVRDNFILCRAWDIASGMGLDKQRERFHVREMRVLLPDGSFVSAALEWTLDRAVLLVAGTPARPDSASPSGHLAAEPPAALCGAEAAGCRCRVVFRAPVRVIVRGKLAVQPTWSDLVVAMCRWVGAFLPAALGASWRSLERDALEASRRCRASAFEGARLDLHRYSARQQSELDLQGVQGSISLPDGPGPLWPLLAAAQWLHLGKGTVMGLGQPEIQPL